MSEDIIDKINQVLIDFFEQNPNEVSVSAKELMPHFIKAGIFQKDHRKGLPIRKVLRALDKDNELHKIPFVHAERKETNTYWYFVKIGADFISKETKPSMTKKEIRLKGRAASDEYYILEICDEILKQKASRQHTFSFILGDLHKDGKSRSRLPLDAYYADLNLVIEYCEKQHSEEVSIFDKPNKMTISGVNRAEQRKIYDKRKRKALKENDINVIDLDYKIFAHDSQKKIVRNTEKVQEVLTGLLKDYIK